MPKTSPTSRNLVWISARARSNSVYLHKHSVNRKMHPTLWVVNSCSLKHLWNHARSSTAGNGGMEERRPRRLADWQETQHHKPCSGLGHLVLLSRSQNNGLLPSLKLTPFISSSIPSNRCTRGEASESGGYRLQQKWTSELSISWLVKNWEILRETFELKSL